MRGVAIYKTMKTFWKGSKNQSIIFRIIDHDNRLPRLYRRGTHLNRLLSVPTCRELALIPTFTDGEFPLN